MALLGVVADLDRLPHWGQLPGRGVGGNPRPVSGGGGAVGLFLQLVGALLLAGDPVGLHYGGGAGAVVEVEFHSEAGRAQRVGGPLDAYLVGALVAGPRQEPRPQVSAPAPPLRLQDLGGSVPAAGAPHEGSFCCAVRDDQRQDDPVAPPLLPGQGTGVVGGFVSAVGMPCIGRRSRWGHDLGPRR